jgi:hypothetical protein
MSTKARPTAHGWWAISPKCGLVLWSELFSALTGRSTGLVIGLTAMGMGFPDNRRKADDSYRASLDAR